MLYTIHATRAHSKLADMLAPLGPCYPTSSALVVVIDRLSLRLRLPSVRSTT